MPIGTVFVNPVTFTVALHNYIAMSNHCDYISFDVSMTFIIQCIVVVFIVD